MNIDDRIKRELEDEAKQLDAILVSQPGLFARLFDTYRGSMRRWMVLVSVIAFFVTAAFLWFGFQFYMATEVDQQVFWGVWFIAMLLVQVTLKMWIFMEMNRSSTMREIKRLELSMERLERAVLSS